MGICNYCTLKHMQKEAGKSGHIVTLLQSDGELGGTDVYVHPQEINIEKLPTSEREHYWKTWLWKISNQCCC